MISEENQRFLIAAVLGLIVLFALVQYTDLPTLVRLPVALLVTFVVQWALEAIGQ